MSFMSAFFTPPVGGYRAWSILNTSGVVVNAGATVSVTPNGGIQSDTIPPNNYTVTGMGYIAQIGIGAVGYDSSTKIRFSYFAEKNVWLSPDEWYGHEGVTGGTKTDVFRSAAWDMGADPPNPLSSTDTSTFWQVWISFKIPRWFRDGFTFVIRNTSGSNHTVYFYLMGGVKV